GACGAGIAACLAELSLRWPCDDRRGAVRTGRCETDSLAETRRQLCWPGAWVSRVGRTTQGTRHHQRRAAALALGHDSIGMACSHAYGLLGQCFPEAAKPHRQEESHRSGCAACVLCDGVDVAIWPNLLPAESCGYGRFFKAWQECSKAQWRV